MSSGLRMWVLVVAMTMTGCGGEGRTTGSSGADPTADALAVAYLSPPAYKAGQQGVLRVRTDGARGRLWVLGLDDLRVYDTTKKRLVRRIVLPNWDVAGRVCDPDMILDGSGSAIISSNVRPKLWRIDAETFALQEREIALKDREQWDIGFSALVLAADGKLFASTSTGGWLWRIDVASASAELWNPDTPVWNVCGVAAIE